ncbi:MAG: hypothetical protein WCY09_08680 [Candidatus Omnitrophota bacterium]
MNDILLGISLFMSTVAIVMGVLTILRLGKKHKFTKAVVEKAKLEKIDRIFSPIDTGDTRILVRDQSMLLSELLNDPTNLDYRQYGRDYESIAGLLNYRAETINPDSITSIPKHVSIYDLLDAMEPAEALDIYRISGLKADIEVAISMDNRDALVSILQVAASILSDNTIRKIQAILAEKEDDPSYSNTVKLSSRAEQIGLAPVNPSDVQTALHNVRW